MRGRGFDLVITSTDANADAQHFWRKMGCVDCGVLIVRNTAAEFFSNGQFEAERRLERHLGGTSPFLEAKAPTHLNFDAVF